MKKLVGGLFGLAAVVGLALGLTSCTGDPGTAVAPATTTTGSPGDEDGVVRMYDAAYTLRADGDLDVVETLTVDFPVARHGIFRVFGTEEPQAPTHAPPRDIAVSRDGLPDQVKVRREDRGRYTRVRIGDPDVTITGEHIYRISYTIPRAWSGVGRFTWALVPPGWELPIDAARLRVQLPSEAMNVRCEVSGGSASECTVRGEGTNTLTASTPGLDPHTSVTIDADLETSRGSAA